jgi:peptidoglycan L-alanyl-D-glutamate endopeptidase CwlK
MGRALDDLHPDFLPLAAMLIARCVEAGIPVAIIFTGRTQEEQATLYAQGRTAPGKIVTWTLDSLHVMKPPEFKSRAIDLCPWEQFNLHGPDKLAWNDKEPAWQTMGEIGEGLGLKWGVIRNGVRIDLGHFALPLPPLGG